MIEYQKTNRQKRMKQKTGKHWCNFCDFAMVGQGEKCGVCRKRNGVPGIKSEPNN